MSSQVNRQRRRVLTGQSGAGATGRVEEALAREADPTALGSLRARLASLTAEDINLLSKLSGPEWRTGVARVTRISLDPRFVKNGYGRLVLPALRRLGDASPVEISELLLLPALNPLAEKILGARFDEPSAADVAQLVDGLLETFPARLVACYLESTVAGEAPAAAAAEVLAADERLAA